jgi:hypothetical protein
VVFASLTDEITLPQFVPCLEGLPLRYDAEEICTTEA